jgi:[ribosomal protein S18]-alanine N-acetyltransferase
MNASITVRPGTPAEAIAIAAIGQKSPTAPRWQLSDYRDIFLTGRTILIAELDGKIAGFVVARDIAGEWELESIAVTDENRKHGIGNRLVCELILKAKNCKAKFIFLEVRESNLPARALYEKSAFEQYGRRKDYYSDPPEDAILYRFLCTPGALENC